VIATVPNNDACNLRFRKGVIASNLIYIAVENMPLSDWLFPTASSTLHGKRNGL
jgi:hypothetical protein